MHKHAATLRRLPGNIFDVAQSRSLEHHRSLIRILRKTHYFSRKSYPVSSGVTLSLTLTLLAL